LPQRLQLRGSGGITPRFPTSRGLLLLVRDGADRLRDEILLLVPPEHQKLRGLVIQFPH